MVDLAPTQMLGMSDDDFLKLNGPESGVTPAADTSTNTPAEGEAGAAQEGGEASPTGDAAGEAGGEKTHEQPSASEPVGAADGDEGKPGGEGGSSDAGDNTGADPAASGANAAGADVKTEGTAAEPEGQAPDYKSFYEKIMAPFKANGKTIELKDPAEAISLMQMGANYTRKMQDIQPHRKVLLMLQNNDLLDEGKLSYLIDLDKKNPEAIKKLIKDAGIDPLEIDVETDAAYQAGNHQVSDREVAFRTVLEDIGSSDTGRETIKTINDTWDAASKEAMWENPEILTIIQQQRETGIYTRIADEIDRQRTLGKIRPETPFLEAYKMVGDAIVAANQGANGQNGLTPEHPAKTEPQVIATRAATPKPEVENNDRANAAAITKAAPSGDKKIVNPLALSDDDFMKLDQFKGRI